MITVKKSGKTTDDIFMIAADQGATDIEEIDDNTVAVYTSSETLSKIRQKLQENGFEIESAEFVRKPNTQIPLDPVQTERVVDFLSSLEELDDVQKVYSNISV